MNLTQHPAKHHDSSIFPLNTDVLQLHPLLKAWNPCFPGEPVLPRVDLPPRQIRFTWANPNEASTLRAKASPEAPEDESKDTCPEKPKLQHSTVGGYGELQ